MANIYPKNYPLGNVDDVKVTTTTISNVYKLGDEVDIYDDTKKEMTKYVYIYARNALVQYGLYQITFSGTGSTEVGAATLPSASTVFIRTCVPQVAIASGSYGWAAIQGLASINTTTDVTSGNFGAAIKSIATATDDGATKTDNSVCIFSAAGTGATTVACYLLGERVLVTA